MSPDQICALYISMLELKVLSYRMLLKEILVYFEDNYEVGEEGEKIDGLLNRARALTKEVT